MAEAQEVEQELETEQEQPQTDEIDEATTHSDEDREPGGADPQAVRARKEYRLRKSREQENAQLRRELDELRGAVKTLKDVQTKPAQERIYSMAEVNAAVEAGKITRAVADQYIEDYILPARVKAYVDKEKQEEAKKQPEERAKAECDEYTKLQPWLNNVSDPRFIDVAKEFDRLTTEYGMADNWITRAMAVRHVVGPLDKLKDKARVRSTTRDATDFHSEAPAGGMGVDTKRVDMSKAPADMVAIWDRTGVSAEDRAKELKIWQDSQARRR